MCAIINPIMVKMKMGILNTPEEYDIIPARHVETKVITRDHGLVAIIHVFNDMHLSLGFD
jgi:hypothetical protein